jgi:hypothetical protein
MEIKAFHALCLTLILPIAAIAPSAQAAAVGTFEGAAARSLSHFSSSLGNFKMQPFAAAEQSMFARLKNLYAQAAGTRPSAKGAARWLSGRSYRYTNPHSAKATLAVFDHFSNGEHGPIEGHTVFKVASYVNVVRRAVYYDTLTEKVAADVRRNAPRWANRFLVLEANRRRLAFTKKDLIYEYRQRGEWIILRVYYPANTTTKERDVAYAYFFKDVTPSAD